MKILYCTNEPLSPVDAGEIARLRQGAEVTVACCSDSNRDPSDTAVVVIRSAAWRRRFTSLWLKVCVLISRLPHSNIARRFPERNVYQGWLAARVGNLSWRLRSLRGAGERLPRFATLARLLPLGWDATDRSRVFEADVVVYNSLLIMSADFLPLLRLLQRRGTFLLANVRSWDNPYYVQFDSRADGYLVWSEHMADSIRNAQGIDATFAAWGANILKSFHEAPKTDRRAIGAPRAPGKNIGYAAAFGDDIVTYAEYEYICDLANRLNEGGVACRILYRPYPTVEPARLRALRNQENVLICDIDAAVLDRYGDGREMIRYGSPEEKQGFLNSCAAFLSLGTTFTLEAFMHGTPVVHFYLPPEARTGKHEALIFNRIEITCDHFFDYFPGVVEFTRSFPELIAALAHGIAAHAKSGLLDRLGIHHLDAAPDLTTLSTRRRPRDSVR
jgi:hypothetical protein